MKFTPVLFVEEVEPSIPFWEALGWAKVVEVPEGDRVGFALLVREGAEIMLQSLASARKDLPDAFAGGRTQEVALYAEVPDRAAARAALGKVETVVEDRDTPYGARETWLRTPSGHLLCLAERPAG